MRDLEQELRETLRRREAPMGFEERVLRRIEQEGARRAPESGGWWRTFRFPALQLAMAALLLILLAGGSLWQYRRQAEIAKGEEARKQVLLALRITGQKLEYARSKVLDHIPPAEQEGR